MPQWPDGVPFGTGHRSASIFPYPRAASPFFLLVFRNPRTTSPFSCSYSLTPALNPPFSCSYSLDCVPLDGRGQPWCGLCGRQRLCRTSDYRPKNADLWNYQYETSYGTITTDSFGCVRVIQRDEQLASGGVATTTPPGPPSVVGCSRRLPSRKRCFSYAPPKHCCGSTSPVLSNHIPPKNRGTPCGRQPGMLPLPFGRPCAAVGCVRACHVPPWLPKLSIFGGTSPRGAGWPHR